MNFCVNKHVNHQKINFLSILSSNDVFDTLPSLPQMNSAKSGKHGRAGSHSATPKNLAFQLIRSHLIKKHYESNHRPNLVKASNMSPFKGQMKNDRLLKRLVEFQEIHTN